MTKASKSTTGKSTTDTTETSDAWMSDLKLIKHNVGHINEPDDPSYPYKLELNFRPPELMQVTFVMLYGGSEEMIVRGKTREAIEHFIAVDDLRHHPRLRRGTITNADGSCEDLRMENR